MTAKYTLYELAKTAHQETPGHSPHTWKTKIDLAILGIETTTVLQSFHQIRTDLSEQSKDNTIKVPVLDIPGKDLYLSDSWNIAEYLDGKYSTPEKSLFHGSEDGKAFAKFLEIWGNTTLAQEIRPIIATRSYAQVDEPSLKYLIKSRFESPEAYEAALAKAQKPESLAGQVALAKIQLQTLEALLAFNESEGKHYLGGSKPGHADAVVFGWYAFAVVVDNEAGKAFWNHPGLERVTAWTERIKKEFVKGGELD